MTDELDNAAVMQKLSEFERKLILDLIKTYQQCYNNYFSLMAPKSCKGYEMQMGPDNANAHMTVKLPLYYVYPQAPTYKKRVPESLDMIGFG